MLGDKLCSKIQFLKRRKQEEPVEVEDPVVAPWKHERTGLVHSPWKTNESANVQGLSKLLKLRSTDT